MQTCSKCHNSSPDTASLCTVCQAELSQFSTTSVALKRFQANARVKNVRLVVSTNCCPACREIEGTYEKNEAPYLPVEGCSHARGCRCFYEPMLNDIYP